MAGNRPTDWHVLDLDKDPTPGDPDRVRNLAKNLHDFADDVSKVLRDIKGMAGEDAILTWAGKTAESFTAEFEDAPGKLKKLKKSYEMAGDALSAYWPELERSQALADKALAQGREAQTSLSAAQSRLTSADSWMERAGKEADKYKDDDGGSKAGKDVPKPDPDKVKAATRNADSAEKAQTAAKSDVSAAKSHLDAAKKMAEDARKMREGAAGTAKKKLEDASDAGIQNRKWWEEVGDWVTDNWDTIVAVCKVVVAVLGVIAMIIGGPILGAIVLIAALVVLADTLHKYANGEAGLLDVAFAALDCIPGMKGLTSLRGLAKGMKGLKAMRLKGMAAGVRGLGKNARGMLGRGADNFARTAKAVWKKLTDPVDLATGQMFLPQTDIELPGILPLAFTRRVASDYRTGWWFGPTWTSTIDQRLEVDEQGVVLVTEDGLLLSYPHPRGPMAEVLPEAGPRWPLTHLDDGGYRVDDPATGQRRLFGAPGGEGLALLERIADRNNNTIDFEYDRHGTPLAIRHSAGYHLELDVDEGRVAALRLVGAADDGTDIVVKKYGYADGNLTSVTNSSGLPLRFTYDERLRITSWTDTNHSRYDYAYDELDRCIAEGGEAGHIAVRLDYGGADPAWPGCHITTLTPTDGAVSRFVINDNCLVVGEIDACGGITRFEYGSRHEVLSCTDAVGSRTEFRNDRQGRPLVVTRPDGSTTTFAYNDLGQPVTLTLPDNSTWSIEYDDRGNRISITDPTGATTRNAFDAQGRLTSVIDAHASTTQVRCNSAGLPVEVSDQLSAVTRYEYDGFGRVTKFVDPLSNATCMKWTVEGKLAYRVAPEGISESWAYDGEGNCIRHIAASGEITSYEYTHFDLLAARTYADGARYIFKHDAALRLTQVVNPRGETWDYLYDAAGRLVSEVDFDNRALGYEHDAAGRVTARVNPLGQVIEFKYDVMGKIVEKNAAGIRTQYEYDSMGRRTRTVGPDAEVTWTYDRAGRVLSETVDDRTLALTYDAVGRRTSRTTPTGAHSTYRHDAAGRQVSISSSGHTLGFSYDESGREIERLVDNTLSLWQGWDTAGRLTDQRVFGVSQQQIQRRTYSYSPDGRLTTINDPLQGETAIRMDAVGRVTEVEARNWTETYAYDQLGNQARAAWPTGPQSDEVQGRRRYDGSRLVGAGSVRYENDAAGRVVVRRKTRVSRKPDVWQYVWDPEDRLVSATMPDGTVWRYRYDPYGRRISKQRFLAHSNKASEEIVFTWEGHTLAEQTTVSSDAPHPVVLTWEHIGLKAIAQTERLLDSSTQEEVDSRFFAIVTDLIGAPTELVDQTGAIAWRARKSAWGVTTWPRNSSAYTPLRFPGQYYDPETGLHYNCFRYYDPEVGRYTTPDPLGLAPAPNPSTYVDNPHVQADPSGLSPYQTGGPDSHIPLDAARGDVHLGSHDEAFNEVLRRFDVSDPSLVSREPMWGRNPNLTGPRGEPWEEVTAIDSHGNLVNIHHHANGHHFTDGAAPQWSLPHYHGPGGEHVYYGDMNSAYGLQGRPRGAG
ncbi:DUF6531 domain-containing protein [Streptomyces sp. NPDC051214]|uniref:DUF6531 domain-containing protein n=1 Tax=Streptomyces sp. NPDC051214 TaxID=3155282 RepID=UPI0034250C8B